MIVGNDVQDFIAIAIANERHGELILEGWNDDGSRNNVIAICFFQNIYHIPVIIVASLWMRKYGIFRFQMIASGHYAGRRQQNCQ